MSDREDLLKALADLTGQAPPLTLPKDVVVFGEGGGLGFSQLNELLLLSGYDRVNESFFQFLVNGALEYEAGSAFESLSSFEKGIERFRILALLLLGNVKFAFKRWSRNVDEFFAAVDASEPRSRTSFAERHDPIWPAQRIPGEDTYFLGYIVDRELQERLSKDPTDTVARAQQVKRDAIRAIGERNHAAYLSSDHLDVYVATSMRRRHEYLVVHDLTQQIFEHPTLKPLKARWFDPTQAYCADRIDKGLSEALMLKRAKCTLYFVQESDTLGKDSELASTLAQGKPVIAFVPDPARADIDRVIGGLLTYYSDSDEGTVILEQFQAADPTLAWADSEVRSWLEDPTTMNKDAARERLTTVVKRQYDRRARTLISDHPLGVQVHLKTGVANGVLVVRRIEDCASLIERILTNSMEFVIEQTGDDNNRTTLLREVISGCVFRVMTGDRMLMNSFWNFYLSEAEPA